LKTPYVSELQPNETIQGAFLVQMKDVRWKKTGDPYLNLTLADKTGELDAKMWDNAAEVIDTFDRDDFVRVKGLLQIFQNRPQLTVHKLQRLDDREINLADFLPASRRDLDEMWTELQALIASLANPHLRALVQLLMDDPAIGPRFKRAPAAKTVHHAWLGGLLEHVLSMAAIAAMTARHYPGIDRDLLMTGVILHDIGKIDELHYTRSFGYTDEGQLMGHILIALRMIGDKIALIPGFPPKLRLLLDHMIVSHHGTLEFGSPKVPQFAEAMLLHLIDNMDSKMEIVRTAIDKDSNVEGNFTAFNPPLERALLKKARFLEDPPPPPESIKAPVKAPVKPAPKASDKPASTPVSPFASKLMGALNKP
jgi:3'-5' exoribonuclease